MSITNMDYQKRSQPFSALANLGIYILSPLCRNKKERDRGYKFL